MTRKVSILFVDDEPNILKAVRRHVRHYRDQWDMHFAYGGVDAVKVITRETVDILVTDMRMPEVDGSQLLEWISGHHPQIIRIVLSGEAKQDEIYRIVGRSHRFLAKPCSPEAIISVIKDIVDAQLHDQLENGIFKLSVLDTLCSPKGLFKNLTSALEAEEPGIDHIAGLVRKDPSLSLRLLQLCNSAYFKQPVPTCSIRKAVGYVGLDRLRELIEAGRLGQECCSEDLHGFAPEDAHHLAEDSKARCLELTQDTEAAAAAFLLGISLRSGAVGSAGTLAQAAKRVAFLTVLFGLPAGLSTALQQLADTSPSAPTGAWPQLIAEAVARQHAPSSKNEVAA